MNKSNMKVIGKIPLILLYPIISLSAFTETIYSSSLPLVVVQLNTEGAIAKFATTAYYLGFTIGIFTLGRISDIYGRRPVILFGISFYILSTTMIIYAVDIKTFIIGRFLQAYGASVGSVVAQAMIRDSYRGWELSYVYSSIAVVAALMPAIGSVIGGHIVGYYGQWQYNFHFLILLSIIMLGIYLKFLPETNPYVGAAHGVCFTSILKAIAKDRILLSCAFIIGAYNGIYFGFYIQAPFIFIERLGLSAAIYGQLFLLLGMANLSGGLITRYLIKRQMSTKTIRTIGFACSGAGCMSLFLSSLVIKLGGDYISLIHAIILIFIPMAVHLIGHAMIIPILLRHALNGYDKVVGSAGSIFGAIYYIITAIVSFIISVFHSQTIDNFAYLFVLLLTGSLFLYSSTNLSKVD